MHGEHGKFPAIVISIGVQRSREICLDLFPGLSVSLRLLFYTGESNGLIGSEESSLREGFFSRRSNLTTIATSGAVKIISLKIGTASATQ